MTNDSSDSSPLFAKLGEDNYATWSTNMKAYLMQKKVWGIVDGSDPQPEATDPGLREWRKDKLMAAGVLFLGLEEGQNIELDNSGDTMRVQDNVLNTK